MASRQGDNWYREQQRQMEKQRREAERAQRRAEAEAKRQEKERAQAYQAHHTELAAAQTTYVEHQVEQLGSVLRDALVADPIRSFDGMRRTYEPRPIPKTAPPPPGPRWEEYAPPERGGVAAFFGLGRSSYERRLAEAQEQFARAEEAHRKTAAAHRERLEGKRRKHQEREEKESRRIREFNASLAERESRYRAGDPEAVEWYLGQVLEASDYPEECPCGHRIAFRPAESSALVEIQLPTEDIVPAARGYTYVKSRDETKVVPRPAKERKDLYASLLAQIALRTVHEVFSSDHGKVLDGVVLNGHVTTVDRATGHEVTPCLITLSTSRDEFATLRLSQVDPAHCLRRLNALVSPNPYELEPIRPIIEFDLSKYRLMDSMDVVAGLDSRPVLLDLSPTEFEHLVRQLFEAIGMEAWNTQPSKDEGVDAVATSADPVFNGLCVIQAKRYSKLVGVESVQALAGVVEHKRAAKGVLITTSWFGRASHAFAAEHGRLQLIEGPQLVYLIKEYLQKDVISGPVPPKRKPR